MLTPCDLVSPLVLFSRSRSTKIYSQLGSTQMQLKIRFGTTNVFGECRVAPFSFLAMAALVFILYFLAGFGKCSQLIPDVERSNVTFSAKEFILCARFMSKCSCPPEFGMSVDLSNCTTDRERTYSRILFLTSFVLQVVVTHDLFTLHGDYSRQIVKSLWIASLITFIGITIAIWQNECYLRYMLFILNFTVSILGTLSFHNLVSVKRHQSTSHNADVYENTNRTRRSENRGSSWRELLSSIYVVVFRLDDRLGLLNLIDI